MITKITLRYSVLKTKLYRVTHNYKSFNEPLSVIRFLLRHHGTFFRWHFNRFSSQKQYTTTRTQVNQTIQELVMKSKQLTIKVELVSILHFPLTQTPGQDACDDVRMH